VLRWAGVALAVVGAGATTYFWLDAQNKNSDYVAAVDRDKAKELGDQMTSSSKAGNITAIIGGVGILALGVSFAF